MKHAREGHLDFLGYEIEYAWHEPARPGLPALVFLHEGLGCVSMWRDFPARVSRATGCGALVYSRPGYGKSTPIPLPWPTEFMHNQAFVILPRVLEAAQIKDAILIGHSDGASIAILHQSSLTARRVRGLVLEAPHVFVEDLTIRSIEAARTAYQETDLRKKLKRHHGADVDYTFRGWNEVWLNPGFRHWAISDYLPAIRVPSLVIQGVEDEYGTAEQVKYVAMMSRGPVEVLMVPDCGHSPHRDQRDVTLNAMVKFIGTLTSEFTGPRAPGEPKGAP